ncbi:hypothetical protein D3C72_2601240 [compost metagenome]
METVLVQRERRIVVAFLVETPLEEQELSESRAFDPFEELLRNDGVRIHVDPVHRSD